MELRPCIDLHDGMVKQIVGGTLSDTDNCVQENFSTDQPAASFARLYQKDDLCGGHVIKLGPNNDVAAREALGAWPSGLQIGGGISSSNAQEWIDAGASHVIVTSFVFHDGQISWENLRKLRQSVGKQRIVLDLSSKLLNGDYVIVTDRWQKYSELTISQANLEVLSDYCDEFLVHAASVEGQMRGPDQNLVTLLGRISPIPVTYAGGITTMEDIELVRTAGENRVHITIGSALDIFGGSLSYDAAVRACCDL